MPVILPPETTSCAIPTGIFGSGQQAGGGMLRMIAYGPEQGVAHPPRPADPKIAWEPDWSARVRTKSTYFGILGMPGAGPQEQAPAEEPKAEKKPKVTDLLKGLFGR